MRGVKRRRSLEVVAAGHAFVHNLRRGHYELGAEHRPHERIRIAVDELAAAL